jgi:hypothetical protein
VKKIIDELSEVSNYRLVAIFTIPITILVIILVYSVIAGGSQQFSELAQAFWHGQLNFLKSIGGFGQDPVFYHGKIYWDDGPFPAIFLMPFVGLFSLFHVFFYQGYIQWLLVIGILYFIFRLAKILHYSTEDSIILTLGFTLGSVFIGVGSISSSWLFAQVLTTFLLFWGLYEFYSHKRWWLIGLICGFILMTRSTAEPILIFFVLELWQQKPKLLNQKIRLYIQLLFPVFIGGCLLGLYNFLRFHNPLNGGYAYQLISPDSAESRSIGIFSLTHIPTNFYSAVLRGPISVLKDNTSWTLKFPYIKNNPYGMSIFITSPYLLSLFYSKWSTFDKTARNLLWATLASCLFIFSYYGLGLDQYGYRYSLDFLPGLFLLFMIMYKKRHSNLSTGMKVLLLGSGVLNFYLAWAFIFP